MGSIPIELSSKQAPIACTLSETDATNQLGEWAELRSHALATSSIEGGTRIVVPAQHIDTARDLAARERACCSFLTITVEANETDVVIDIVSPDPDGQVVIQAITAMQ